MRAHQRQPHELRPILFERNYTQYAEGSVLVRYGNTQVLCTVSILEGVPPFLKGTQQGWLTAEYSMLPRATHTRSPRESMRGKVSGRTHEIQRLIGRALRNAIDLKALKEITLTIDCDVLQADGGTRTAAITGACVALADAVSVIKERNLCKTDPWRQWISAVSVGIHNGVALLDLDYMEDSNCDVDMNVVMTQTGSFIELQGTGEQRAFTQNELHTLLELAKQGVDTLLTLQQRCIEAK